jgi:hypothetical protein
MADKGRELRDTPLNLRVRASLKAALEQAAEDESRSVNSLIEMLATAFLQERGYLPGGAAKRRRK